MVPWRHHHHVFVMLRRMLQDNCLYFYLWNTGLETFLTPTPTTPLPHNPKPSKISGFTQVQMFCFFFPVWNFCFLYPITKFNFDPSIYLCVYLISPQITGAPEVPSVISVCLLSLNTHPTPSVRELSFSPEIIKFVSYFFRDDALGYVAGLF